MHLFVYWSLILAFGAIFLAMAISVLTRAVLRLFAAPLPTRLGRRMS